MYNLSIWTKKCCRSGVRLGRDVAQGCYTKGCWVVRRCQAYPPQSTAGTTQTANPWWLSLTEFSLLAAPNPRQRRNVVPWLAASPIAGLLHLSSIPPPRASCRHHRNPHLPLLLHSTPEMPATAHPDDLTAPVALRMAGGGASMGRKRRGGGMGERKEESQRLQHGRERRKRRRGGGS